MKLRLVGHDSRYSVEQIQLMLFPEEKISYTGQPFTGDGAVSRLSEGTVWLTATTKITRGGISRIGTARCRKEDADEPLRRQILRRSYYRAALPFLDGPPAWGALSGVRPVKLVSRHLMAGGTLQSADRMLRDVYEVTPARRQLCLEAAQASMAALERQQIGDISLYAGIPFCPTRCIYCSFAAVPLEIAGNLVEPYLAALAQEIHAAAENLRETPHRIRTVYIGGGTPTSLNALQLRQLLDLLHREFDLTQCLEFTVEAGRPDTLDFEKLNLLRECGVTRISINPQTMDDRVLQILGRSHTGADILRAYDEAVRAGHDNINMDLIAGLPGDTLDGFISSVETVLRLHPASVTVHTLALKKAAALYYGSRTALPTAEDTSQMLEAANQALREDGYHPYYLYRQKYMTGSFENVGWCRAGYENLYNIYMMEEFHSILSLGAGGVTKTVADGKISRLSSPKYPQDYIRGISEIAAKKRKVIL